MKCQKWIKTNHFPIKNNIISSQKKFQPNRSFLRPPEFPLKFGSDPLKGEKKKCSDYGVHGIQIDRLGLTISTQKSVLKNVHRVQRYYQKSVQNRPSKPNQQNLTRFSRYLETRCIFFKTIFCIATVSPSRFLFIFDTSIFLNNPSGVIFYN